MMRLMADKHGWSIEGQARPTGPDALPSASPTAPLPAPHTPAYTDPGMSHSSRAPAALGAPLGEESFPPMGPPPLPVREREYVDPLSALTESDWSSLPGSSATEADVWSVTSAAPPPPLWSGSPTRVSRSRRTSKLNMIGLQASTHPR